MAAITSCPCCLQTTPFELVPNRRRMGALCKQMSDVQLSPVAAETGPGTATPGVSSPNRARAGGAPLSAEQLATKGTEPFRIKHTEGPDAEPAGSSSGSHRGPAQEWFMQNIADDLQVRIN